MNSITLSKVMFVLNVPTLSHNLFKLLQDIFLTHGRNFRIELLVVGFRYLI